VFDHAQHLCIITVVALRPNFTHCRFIASSVQVFTLLEHLRRGCCLLIMLHLLFVPDVEHLLGDGGTSWEFSGTPHVHVDGLLIR